MNRKNNLPALFPVLYDFRDLVAGNGYVAQVEILGRVLLEEDADEVSFSGVQPSGLAGSGANRGEAWAEYLARHRAVLFDMADEASDFDGFRNAVKGFFDEPNGDMEALWGEAVAAVRRRDVEVPHRRVTVLKVVELEGTQRPMNYLDPQPEIVAEAA